MYDVYTYIVFIVPHFHHEQNNGGSQNTQQLR